jgi:hypothetical protein
VLAELFTSGQTIAQCQSREKVLRQSLYDCEAEKRELLLERSSLLTRVELLTAELESFKRNQVCPLCITFASLLSH